MFPKIASLPLGIPKPRIVRLMRRRLAGSAPLGGSSRPSAVSPQQILRHRVTTNFTNGVTCGYSTLPTSPEGANVEVGSFVDKGVSGDRALDQAAEAFPGVLIDDPDDLYRPPVGSGIELEVHRPHSVGWHPRSARPEAVLAPRRLRRRHCGTRRPSSRHNRWIPSDVMGQIDWEFRLVQSQYRAPVFIQVRVSI
jgi:hypothetical protein